MLFYLLFPIVIISLAFIAKKYPKGAYFAIPLMFFFSVFRGDKVGTDTMNYQSDSMVEYVGNVVDINSGDSMEIVYLLLMKYVYYTGVSPRMIITFFSIVTMLFLFLGLQRYKVNIAAGASFFILLNFYYDSFNVARQVTAISILFYATSYLIEIGKSRYYFFLWLLFAAMFHVSTVVGVIFWFSNRFNFVKRKVFIFMLFFSIVCLVIPFYGLLEMIVSKIGFAGHYEDYFSLYEIQQFSFFGAVFKFVTSLILLCVFLRRNRRKRTDWIDNIYLLSLFITFLLTYSNMVSKRLIMNFSFIQIIYLSIFYFSKRRKLKKIDYVTLFTFLLLIYYDSFLYSFNLGKTGYYMQFNIF